MIYLRVPFADPVHRQIDAGDHRKALAATEGLLKELKQLDDKIILTEVFLLESRAAHAIQNIPRAKVCGALSVPQKAQADISPRPHLLPLVRQRTRSTALPSSKPLSIFSQALSTRTTRTTRRVIPTSSKRLKGLPKWTRRISGR